MPCDMVKRWFLLLMSIVRTRTWLQRTDVFVQISWTLSVVLKHIEIWVTILVSISLQRLVSLFLVNASGTYCLWSSFDAH